MEEDKIQGLKERETKLISKKSKKKEQKRCSKKEID